MRSAGVEVMMNDPKYLRADSILAAFSQAGAAVAVVTAKDKLRRLLGEGLRLGPERAAACFSSERAAETTRAEHGLDDAATWLGRPVPSVYTRGAVRVRVRRGCQAHGDPAARPRLSLHHRLRAAQARAGDAEANAFYQMMDGYLARLDALGATVALTADHGMNGKTDAAGRPQVIYLQDVLDGWIGAGRARVILPITDPYVVHHGALGSFATVHLPGGVDAGAMVTRIGGVAGMEVVLDRDEACRRFELPKDRMGDVVAVSRKDWVIGTAEAKHDLSGLDAPLRSHGGLSEQRVPLIVSRPAPGLAPGTRLRNFDIYDVALNHAA
jgi:phosphonoacetate hydrolase